MLINKTMLCLHIYSDKLVNQQVVTDHIFGGQLCTETNVCLPKRQAFLDDVMSQRELTTT